MKKIFYTLSILMLSTVLFAQTPQSFKYQAVIRDVSGNVLSNQTVGLQFSILEGSDVGSSVYTETWTVQTNQFGLISLNVGEGSSSDNFSTVPWGTNSYYLKVEIDENGDSNYTTMGTSQLLSVPYALYAGESANGSSQWINSGSNIYYNSGNVGVGTNSPSSLLDVNGTISSNGGNSNNWNTAYGWGNHATAGYLTSYIETDPIYSSSPASGIGNTNISNWNTAYGWGNHATAGYLTSYTETDPIYSSSPASGIGNTNISNWNTAYGWGNHATAGYLTSDLWTANGNDIYYNSGNVGIGTSTPTKKLVIKAQNPTDTLLEIQDMNGNPLVVITPSLTKFNIINQTKGTAGGFAVGRYSLAKAAADSNYFLVTRDSTRVYTDETGTKGTAGGFAVGRYSLAKGGAGKYFYTGIDSTRVYTDGSGVKGTAGGFAVGRYSLAKGSPDTYMHMTTDNYFIGHSSGYANTTGTYNLFFGYQSGFKNRTGNRNTFLGHFAGYNNAWGDNNIYIGDSVGYSTIYAHDNIFIGNSSGYHTEADDPLYGSQNVFVGNFSGYKNIEGFYNVYIGQTAGHDNLNGYGNVFVGGRTGEKNLNNDNTLIGGASLYKNTSGSRNTTLGAYSGTNNLTGSYNVFLGYQAGYNETGSQKLYIENSNSSSPLIYGEFDNDILRFNANVGISTAPTQKLQINGNVYASGGDFYAATTNGVINCGGGIMSAAVNVISDGTLNNGYATGDEDLYINDALEVDGEAYKTGTGTWTIQSDKRLKKDIREYKDGLNQILKINPVYFKYNEKAGVNDADKEYVGIIAQDIKAVAPYTVELTPFNKTEIEDENGKVKEVKWDGTSYYTFNPSALTYMLINGMKEQQKLINKQELENQNQNKEIEQLKQQIQELKDLIQNK